MTKEKGIRNSNVELLRIVAIILVLIIHGSFRSLGAPTYEEISTLPFSSFLRFFSQSASVVCVNIFILISGWFGITIRTSRIVELLFQILFFCTIIYIVLILMGITTFSISRYIRLFFFNGSYWFIKAYLFLYILSPLLNIFAEKSSKRQMITFLIAFFSFQTIYDCIADTPWLGGGFSPISFIGLYLLARFLRNDSNQVITKQKGYIYFIIYCSTVLFSSFMSLLLPNGMSFFYYYSSPIVIISSVSLFLFFIRIRINSKMINWIAVSSFAVYIFHSCPLVFESYFITQIQKWHSNLALTDFIINSALFFLCIFSLSIFLDKVRIIIWHCIDKQLQTRFK